MAVALNDWADYCRFRHHIAALLDTRFHTIGWLDGEVLTGSARVWALADACIVATVNTFPTGGKEVHGLVAVGDLAGIVELIPRAEEWGREQGCIVASISSREAWGKVLASSGYLPFQTTVRKELGIVS